VYCYNFLTEEAPWCKPSLPDLQKFAALRAKIVSVSKFYIDQRDAVNKTRALTTQIHVLHALADAFKK
jgi:hypothetical protein